MFLCGLQAHQAFLQDLYRYKIQLLLKGKPRHAGGHAVYLQVHRDTHMAIYNTTPLGTPCRAYVGLSDPVREAGGISKAGDVSDTCLLLWCERSTWTTCGRGCSR